MSRGERFVGFGSVDPNRPDALDRLARFPSLGLNGLKLHPTLQEFDPGDDRFLPFFDAAAELGLILLTHAGTSGLGAGEPGGQGLRIDLARPILLDRIAARHPRMPIVLAHVGWPWHLDAVAMALHKTNVYLDISGWKYRYLPDDVRREMPRRLRGQFLFGTDYPMFDPEACVAEFAGLGCPTTSRGAILRDNAVALLAHETAGGWIRRWTRRAPSEDDRRQSPRRSRGRRRRARADARLIDPALVPRPLGLAQRELLHLAGGGLRQRSRTRSRPGP